MANQEQEQEQEKRKKERKRRKKETAKPYRKHEETRTAYLLIQETHKSHKDKKHGAANIDKYHPKVYVQESASFEIPYLQ